MTNPNAICGNCGRERWDHLFYQLGSGRTVVYCLTVAQEYRDSPSAVKLIDFMSQRVPLVVEEMVKLWRKENGHE